MYVCIVLYKALYPLRCKMLNVKVVTLFYNCYGFELMMVNQSFIVLVRTFMVLNTSILNVRRCAGVSSSVKYKCKNYAMFAIQK